MERFSITEVALTGFRIVRERPKVIVFWGAAHLVFSLCVMLLVVALAGPALTRLSAMSAATAQHLSPAEMLAQYQQILPMYLVVLGLGAIFYPILYAAMNRAVLRPNEDRFGYLRVGADEFRQLGLFVLMFLCGLLAYLALIVVTALTLAVVVGISTAAFGHAGSTAVGLVVGVTTVIAMVAAFCAWIYVCVRFSLASPLTFATGRINLFGSWGLTRKIVWPALGCYLVAFALLLGVWLLYMVIVASLDLAIGGGFASLGAVLHPDMSSIAAYLTPMTVLNLLVGPFLYAMMWPIILTPPAAIYQRTTPGDMSQVFG